MISDQNAHLHPVEVLGKNPQWVAFVEDETLKQLLEEIIANDVLPLACLQKSEIAKIRAFLNSGIEPQVLLLDLSASTNLIEDAKSLVHYCSQNTRVIVVGKDDHIAIFRELKHIGVIDYLVLPLQETAVRNAINEALLIPTDQLQQSHAAKLKPFIVVLGARAGAGVTTTCINLAWLTANEFKKKVCLIDFDFYQGTICLLLDIVQNTGLNDALNESERLDETYLKRLLLKKNENLSILAGQMNYEQEANFTIDAARSLIALLRNKFEFVYTDLPSTLYSPLNQAVLSLADEVIIVTDLTLVSLKGILRLKAFTSTYMPHLKTKILANDIFPSGGGISKAMFEKGVNSKVDDILPCCKTSMLESQNTGEPFTKLYPNHKYTKVLREFILSNYPHLQKEPPKKLSFLERIRRSHK